MRLLIASVVVGGCTLAAVLYMSLFRHKRVVVQSAYALNLPIFKDIAAYITANINSSPAIPLRASVLPPESIVATTQLEAAVQDGRLYAAFTGLSYATKQHALLELYTSTPFGMKPLAFLTYMLERGGLDRLNKLAGVPNNLYYYPVCLLPPELGGWFQEPLTHVEQLRGKRVRVYGLARNIMANLGATPIMAAIGAIPAEAASPQGLFGAELSVPEIDQAAGMSTIFPYFHTPGWNQTATLLYWVMRLDAWQALGAEAQAQLQQSLRLAMLDAYIAANPRQIKALKAMQSQRRELPPTVLAAFRAEWNKILAADQDLKAEYDSMMSFQEAYDAYDELMLANLKQ